MDRSESFERAMKKHRRYIRPEGHIEIAVAEAKIPCESEEQVRKDLRKVMAGCLENFEREQE